MISVPILFAEHIAKLMRVCLRTSGRIHVCSETYNECSKIKSLASLPFDNRKLFVGVWT